MPSSALHRFAIFLATCTLCLVAAVALGRGGVSPESERPIAIVLLVLTILQAGWVTATDNRTSVRVIAWLLVLATGAILTAPALLRASVAQVLFALAISVVVVSSPSWARGPRPVEDEGVPSMRTLGWLAPLCVFIQVLLGAGTRYNALPVWPHVTGSLVFGAILMFAGMAALQSYGSHDALKRVSTALLWVTGMQLTLGMAAYGVRMTADPQAWTVHLTVAHVVTGALTLGAATAFALQVLYHVRETLLTREATA